MTEEIWKDIPGYEGKYQVSNMGNVKSLNFKKEKILTISNRADGYCTAFLVKNGKRKGFSVHRLVACVFSNTQLDTDLEVDHINTIKTDNRLDNLRLCTHKENCNNYTTKNKRNYSTNTYIPKKVLLTDIITKEEKIFKSIRECEEYIGYCKCGLHKRINGHSIVLNRYMVNYA